MIRVCMHRGKQQALRMPMGAEGRKCGGKATKCQLRERNEEQERQEQGICNSSKWIAQWVAQAKGVNKERVSNQACYTGRDSVGSSSACAAGLKCKCRGQKVQWQAGWVGLLPG